MRRARWRRPDSSRAINIQVNVDASPIAATDFEVTLRLEGKAESQGMLLFSFELVFAGAFRVQNVPPTVSSRSC